MGLVFGFIALVLCPVYATTATTPTVKILLGLIGVFVSSLTFSLFATPFSPKRPFLFLEKLNPLNFFFYTRT
jgi:uncharacterized membrane protein YeaQ/YmgE (transglycosylase-associated protein family)